jgi:hypothetical protein
MVETTQVTVYALSSAHPHAVSDADDILVLARQLIVQHGTEVVNLLDARAAMMRKEGQPRDARFWQSVADCAANILDNHWTRH